MGKVYQRSGTKYTLYWKCYHFIYLYIDTQNELVKECIIYEEIRGNYNCFFSKKNVWEDFNKILNNELHVEKILILFKKILQRV